MLGTVVTLSSMAGNQKIMVKLETQNSSRVMLFIEIHRHTEITSYRHRQPTGPGPASASILPSSQVRDEKHRKDDRHSRQSGRPWGRKGLRPGRSRTGTSTLSRMFFF